MKENKLIDTHAHLYLEEFSADLPEIMRRSDQEGVDRIYLPAIDSAHHDSMLKLEAQYPGKCLPMMGLHPCYVKENYEQELRKVEEALAKRAFAAVGEIGLDYYWDRNFDKEQELAFERQIMLSLQYAAPIVVHSRNATEECIRMVRKHAGVTGIFHCFSGSVAQAQEIIGLGMYLGIGGVVTYKNSGLAETVAAVPLEHIVLETDAPYLSPVPLRGKRNESSYLKYIVKKIAEVKGMEEEDVAAITTENALKVFRG